MKADKSARTEGPAIAALRANRVVPHRRYSDCYAKRQSRWADVKCASNAPLSSRSGRIASGIIWRRRGGAVLGRPCARVPKVSPEMVGPLLRGNDFGGNPQEGGKQYSNVRRRTLYSTPRARRFLGSYSPPPDALIWMKNKEKAPPQGASVLMRTCSAERVPLTQLFAK